MMSRLKSLYPYLSSLVLLAAVCQVGLGARFTETGEQVGIALPVSSLVLAAVLAICLLVEFPPPLPALGWSQSFLLTAFAIGLLGLPAREAAGGAKELVQLLEMALLAPYVFERIARAGYARAIVRGLGGLTVLVLLAAATGLQRHPWVLLSSAKAAVLVIVGWPFLLVWLDRARPASRLAVLLPASAAVGAGFQHGGHILVWFLVLALGCRPRRLLAWKWLAVCGCLALAGSLLPFTHSVNPWRALDPRYDATHMSRPAIEAVAALKAPRYYPLGGGPGRYKRIINELKEYQPHIPHPDDRTIPPDGNNQYLLTLVESGLPAVLALLALLLVQACRRPPREPPGEHAEGDAGDTGTTPAYGAALRLAFLGALLAGGGGTLIARGSSIWLGALLGLANAQRPVPSRQTRFVRLAIPAVAIAAAFAAMLLVNRQARPLEGVSTANRIVRRFLFREHGLQSYGLRVALVPDSVGAEASDVVHVEAESFDRAEPPMVVVGDNEAAGHAALSIPQGKGKGAGAATYTVAVPRPGLYRLFARVYWLDGCSNSLLFEQDEVRLPIASDTYQRWHTLEAKHPLVIRKSPVTIRIRTVEDGVRLDYFTLQRIP